MGLRAVLGPKFGVQLSRPNGPPSQGKADVSIAVSEVNEADWSLSIAIPAYSLDTHNSLAAIRAYLVPGGHGLPDSAQGYLDSSYDYSEVDTAGFLEGGTIRLGLPEVADGQYFGQTVLLFDDGEDVEPGEPEPTGEEAAQEEAGAVPTTG